LFRGRIKGIETVGHGGPADTTFIALVANRSKPKTSASTDGHDRKAMLRRAADALIAHFLSRDNAESHVAKTPAKPRLSPGRFA
jgi:hypothetical protein